MRIPVAVIALAAALLAGEALAEPDPGAGPFPLTVSRFLSLAAPDDFGEPVEPPDKSLEDVLGEDEETEELYRKRLEERKRRETEQRSLDQIVERYAGKKITNMRFAFTVYNVAYRTMKEGSAGWGHYDDLFESGAIFTRLHLGDKTSIWIPTGGFEVSYIGAPLYQAHFGMGYDLFTGKRFLNQEFSDFFITSYYLGLRFNLINEYTATQQFAEMLEYADPPHITGLQIYLKGSVGLHILNRVLVKGDLTGPNDSVDTYFKQTQSFGYSLLAGVEYRIFTMGFFFETGWSFIVHPVVARPLTDANHFRSFPILVGINVYFGG